MRWQIEQYVFCDKQQNLQKGEDKQQLEPMVAELLSYFCQHPEQIISRNQLIEHVWLGRVVSDNAVNRVVTKLRKAFNDDAKKPRYIATLPKKGYKFIASVASETSSESMAFNAKGLECGVSGSFNEDTKKSNKFSYLLGVSCILTLPVILLFWLTQIDSSVPQTSMVKVQALTRDAGREFLPRVSPDGHYLAYAERKDQKMSLWIKSLENQERVEINHGEQVDTWAGPASWNQQGNKLVYLVTTPTSCQYFIRGIDGLALGEPQLIYECPAGSYGKIEFLHSDTRFVLTESPAADMPYTLYEFDMNTGEKRRLTQPEQILGGNSLFDVHPIENMILISSPDEKLWEGFYSLNVDTDELKLLFKQDAYICCGIWDHTGTRVVLMGEHPAFELISYDLKGESPQVIYSGIHQLRPPHRHSNGVDYLFSSGHVNQNVYYFNEDESEAKVLINASVDDRLAVFSNSTRRIAYISLSSGSEEVWLSDHEGKEKRKLTRFNDSRHYFDLQWFPDDSKLIGMALNEVHVIDAKTGAYEKLDLPQNEYRAVSVKNSTTIAFSQEVAGKWRLHFYDIESGKLDIQNEQWQFASFSLDPHDTLWVDKDNQVFSGPEKSRLPLSTILKIQEPLLGKVLSLQKLGNKLAWQQFDGGEYQLFEKTGNEPASLISTTDSRHFDISASGILYHKVESANSDIYTTQAN